MDKLDLNSSRFATFLFELFELFDFNPFVVFCFSYLFVDIRRVAHF